MGIHLAPAGPPSASSGAHPGSRRGGFGDAMETSAENSRTPPRGITGGRFVWENKNRGPKCTGGRGWRAARGAGASSEGGCAGCAVPRDIRPTSSAKRGAPPASRARPASQNVRPRRAHAPPPRSARSWRTARAAGQLGLAAGSPHVWRAGCPPPDVFGRPARMPGHTPRRLRSMSISGTSGAAAAPRRALRRRSGAQKIVRGMRRGTAHVTPCIRARAWMLEPLQ